MTKSYTERPVDFTSDQGAWTVAFDNNVSPFPIGSAFSGDKGASQGGIIEGNVDQRYKYTSCCTPDGGATACLDPDIVIDSY